MGDPMQRATSILAAVMLLFAAALPFGCAIKPKPFEYEPVTEMKKEPGVFSGESGDWTLRAPAGGPAAARPQPAGEQLSPSDSEEFRRFQQWQQEKREFEAFQEWKRSPAGASEYEEFLEWQRWQAFKRWQESQAIRD